MIEQSTDPARARTNAERTRSAEGQMAIDASAERVWRALTDARELERWFPLDARVEPGEGGTIFMSWRNEFAADMRILVWDPPRHLRTAWPFHADDQPAQVTDYTIESHGGRTVVRAVTSGFPLDSSWDGWVEGTRRGWAFELRSLKHYLERHEGEPRHVAYLRRRVTLSIAEAWHRLEGDSTVRQWFALGDPFDRSPGRQHAAVLPLPNDDLFRISIEPGAPGAHANEVVMFVSSWGDRAARTRELQTQWSAVLERVFPEGTTP
jgi:uncharacterized protein YndB with AHSA1/START domain